jgi:2-C-methyl-D-erythritol 4-phosphate cytidylyltransferase
MASSKSVDVSNKTKSSMCALWFVVPAAGIGQRMGADRPKQYMPLSRSTVLEYTLQTILSIRNIAGIVVAIHPNDTYWPQTHLSQHDKITTVIGGAERCDSVLAALQSLQGRVSNNDWVLVHDAARPCVLPETIYHLIDTLLGDEVGGILGVPSSDTLKKVGNDGFIKETIKREQIWQAQTPQMFRYEILRLSLMHAISVKNDVTDEASAVEKIGYSVRMVQGHSDNIKITHADDLSRAEAIIARAVKTTR